MRLLFALGALVTLVFAASGAGLILAATRAGGACCVKGCRCEQGQCNGSENRFHHFPFVFDFCFRTSGKSGHGARSSLGTRWRCGWLLKKGCSFVILLAPSKISTGRLRKGRGGLNSQDGVKRAHSACRTLAGGRFVNVVRHFATAGMLLNRRTKTLRDRYLWPRKNHNHRHGQKPSCRLKATIHFLKGSPKPHPVKGPNIFCRNGVERLSQSTPKSRPQGLNRYTKHDSISPQQKLESQFGGGRYYLTIGTPLSRRLSTNPVW